jgi:hypothetical protein
MGMQWQMGGRPLDFNDVGLRAAYQPRHAASKRHQQARVSVAEETGPNAAGTQNYTYQRAAADCRSYGFAAVTVRQVLLDRAATLVRLHPRRHEGGPLSQRGWA